MRARPAELLVLGQHGVPGADRTDRPGNRSRQASATGPPGRSHHGAGPAAAAVKGLNPAAYFGIFDVVRLDTVCLDKA